jgi:LPXTG-motif cell wall-anchored protein
MFAATLTRDHGHIRRILIVALATLMLFATLAVAPTARANGNPPSTECASPLWNGGYWKIQINDGTPGGIEAGGGVASGDISYSVAAGVFSWTNDHSSDSVFRWLFKSGQTPDAVHNGLWAPSAGDSDTMPTDLSHVTICFTETPEPELGTIIVEKQTDPDGDSTAFTFTGDAAGAIADGETIVVSDLTPGEYTSTETVPAGWDLTSIVCDDEGASGDVGTETATFNIVGSETLKCVFTNTKQPPPPAPDIDIEKATNGHDADSAKGPYLVVGSTVTWTYVVTNPGDVALADIKVTDNMGVNPVYQGGDTNTDGLLDVTETWTYKATGTATAGQYANIGFVTGFYQQGEKQVAAEDPSHYWGYIPPPVDPDTPRIDIEKATNGVDADLPTGPSVPVGSTVTWTYVVTNTGNVPLTDVEVTDDKLGAITCPKTTLIILEEMTCTATGTAQLVNYANLGTVVGSYGSVTVTDKDPSHYSGVAVKGTAQLGDTVWLDVNKNGVQDNGEVGYNGADVILKDADGNVVATLTTATGAWVGFYKFLELDAGVYTAMLDLSTIGTYKVSTANSFTITLAEGDDYLDADFGLYEETTPPTTTVPPEETLPATGAETEGMALLGLGLLLLGTLAILATRKRRATD